MLTEDEVRRLAHETLFANCTADAVFDTGQITKFNSLGFPGVMQAPDAWYLPKKLHEVTCVFEFKSESHGLDDDARKQLFDEMEIVLTKYAKVCGVLWDGKHIEVYTQRRGDDCNFVEGEVTLEPVSHYVRLFEVTSVDRQEVYRLTASINNNLHFEFGIKNLYHRMIFTACALIAEINGAELERLKGMGFSTFHNRVQSIVNKSLGDALAKNAKLKLVLDVFAEIQMNTQDKQDAIDSFIDDVCELSEFINSDKWQGTDVMAIFFNEFTRYKGKSEAGQVFTPEHIADFMCELIEVGPDDRVLDAACGSGTFLCKAMAKMMDASGGYYTTKSEQIRSEQLFGIEFDREVFALGCASMLIHKDGKTNMTQLDSRTEEACAWIRDKGITKVLMNPPYERKYGCMTIVKNVLDNVSTGCMCAFIMPDKKLEKESKRLVKSIFENHRLLKVLKLPDVFFGVGVSTSIFVFEAGKPQGNKKFWACDLGDDGFEVVKNKGRHDVRGKWADIEVEWLDVCERTPEGGDHNGQWHTIDECMSYQQPEKPFEIYEEDFRKTALDFLLFQMRDRGAGGEVTVDMNALLLRAALYQSRVEVDADGKKQLVIDLGE